MSLNSVESSRSRAVRCLETTDRYPCASRSRNENDRSEAWPAQRQDLFNGGISRRARCEIARSEIHHRWIAKKIDALATECCAKGRQGICPIGSPRRGIVQDQASDHYLQFTIYVKLCFSGSNFPFLAGTNDSPNRVKSADERSLDTFHPIEFEPVATSAADAPITSARMLATTNSFLFMTTSWFLYWCSLLVLPLLLPKEVRSKEPQVKPG